MAVATYCYYEKLSRKMHTAFVLYLLRCCKNNSHGSDSGYEKLLPCVLKSEAVVVSRLAVHKCIYQCSSGTFIYL